MQHPTQPKLMLAVHTVATATAKVPFAMILLLDFAKRRATPAGSRCRMVVPSDGTSSMSLWDTEDPEGLLEWLTDNLGGDCITQLSEVQEDFTYGLSLELTRMRATEKTIGALGETTSKAAGVLAAGVTTAVGSTQQRLEAFDQRTGMITTTKETTAAIAQRAMDAMSKAAEDRRVQSVVTNVQSGVTTGWAKLSGWVGDRMKDLNVNEGGAGEYGAPPRDPGYTPSQGQVHMPTSYAGAHQPSQQQQQQQQPLQQPYTLSSGGGGSSYAPAVDKPSVPASSSLLTPPEQQPPKAAAPAAAAAAAPAAAPVAAAATPAGGATFS